MNHFRASDVLFSSRWVASRDYSVTDAFGTARDFHATQIVWHYLKDKVKNQISGETVAQATADGLDVNCALPLHTYNPEAACLDANKSPIPGSGRAYYPDTNTKAFRIEVTQFLQVARDQGCTSLQQDGPMMMVFAQEKGCYADRSREDLFRDLDDYYNWLRKRIKRIFGKNIPISYNKKFFKDEATSPFNRIARHFDSVMAEVAKEQNNPISLFNAIHEVNYLTLNLQTATTLISTNPLKYQQHIATVYALGGLPIAPWDVFIESKTRFYGDPQDYQEFYKLVRDQATSFDGFKLVAAYLATRNKVKILLPTTASSENKISLLENKMNVAVVLKADGKKRALHVINWQKEGREFRVLLPRSVVGARAQSKSFIEVAVYSPGKAMV
ncbi:MAG: hypothetical protein ACREBU_16640, partial [Nitrososphaera sp.]